jgi:hypothetical protein
MELSKKDQKIIKKYETRLKYASNMAEIAFCRAMIKSVLDKAKEKDQDIL